jgi:hypothetical protein
VGLFEHGDGISAVTRIAGNFVNKRAIIFAEGQLLHIVSV